MTAFEKFKKFHEEFKDTDLWAAMERTVENSPWHREANVAVHTQMLLNYYEKNFLPHRSESQQTLSLLGCLFHDVGKPMAEITKYSEERGEYRAYHGHEQLSARLWVDYALNNQKLVSEYFGFGLAQISNVALMIEYHVPFNLKDKFKRKNLKTALELRLGTDGHQAWLDMLMCDQHGRISDDQETKLAAVDKWMEEWRLV